MFFLLSKERCGREKEQTNFSEDYREVKKLVEKEKYEGLPEKKFLNK